MKLNSPSIYSTTKSGFTLVEVIVAVAIMSLIIGAFAALFVYFFRSYHFSLNQGNTVDEAKVAISKITSELREAQTSEDGAYPLIMANDQELAFYADVDNDDRVERIRYYLDGNTFTRGIIEPGVPPVVYDLDSETTTIISDDVQNTTEPIFLYYNQNWPGDSINNPLSQAERLLDTRLIRVELLINTDPDQQSDFEITIQAMLRNLKTN